MGTMGQAAPVHAGVAFKHVYEVECYGPDGNLKWRDVSENLVTNEGLDEILDKFWKGSGYTAAFYVGLTDGTPSFAAGDTAAAIDDSPATLSWAEEQTYSEGARQGLTLGTVSSQSVDNSASKASFSINGSATIGGAFIITDNTKGGATGILIGGAAFTGGDRSASDGDTVNVTATLTASSA